MRVLWVCNVAIPEIARQLNMEVSNKEGWLSGMAHAALKNSERYGLELVFAFPVPAALCENECGVCSCRVTIEGREVECFGFYEDTAHADRYDPDLEKRMDSIVKSAGCDMVHCFGTEYPHTLATCKVFPDKSRVLVGIQGLCFMCAKAYFANLPKKVVYSKTLRDILRKDSIVEQYEKFVRRGEMEIEALKMAGNITGRTGWDRENSLKWNGNACYFEMNENLRADFYDSVWDKEKTETHSIFLSQGDYPLKGLHYMLKALPYILERFPDAKVYVAGNSLVAYGTWKEKLKISAYGKYLRSLIKQGNLQEQVVFLGRLSAAEMKEQYLKSSLYVCCSSVENSPNSLGEAMLLGMPCVAANVGGIPSLFTDGEDGLMFEGFQMQGNNMRDFIEDDSEKMENVAKSLAVAVLRMWENEGEMLGYCKNARNHARKTHDREANFGKMMEMYAKIVEGQEG